MNIGNVREYISQYTKLDEDTVLNVNYLSNEVISYSVTEEASYNPVIKKDVIGNEYCQFLFNFDAKLNWNDETQNNINNSEFFNEFSSWVKQQNKDKNFPQCDTGCEVDNITATSNGYIFATESNEAIYRISCKIEYRRKNEIN